MSLDKLCLHPPPYYKRAYKSYEIENSIDLLKSAKEIVDLLQRLEKIANQKRERVLPYLPEHERNFIESMPQKEQMIYYLSQS
jgi:hypothetical protein